LDWRSRTPAGPSLQHSFLSSHGNLVPRLVAEGLTGVTNGQFRKLWGRKKARQVKVSFPFGSLPVGLVAATYGRQCTP